MSEKLLITQFNNKDLCVFCEGMEVKEIRCAGESSEAVLGDVYIGRVEKIREDIHAAFVEIGPGKSCFFHLEEAKNSIFTARYGNKPLNYGDELIVQVSREGFGEKLPSVTGNISLTGEYSVLTSGKKTFGVSHRIPQAKRDSLYQLLSDRCTDDFGFVIRTNAVSASDSQIISEMEELTQEFEALKAKAVTRKCFSLLKKAVPDYEKAVIDLNKEGETEIITDIPEIYDKLQVLLQKKYPEFTVKLRFYDDKMLSLAALYDLKNVIHKALREKVWLKSGGFIIIQPTEAMTVIDVNSGKALARGKAAKRDLQYKINLEAAEEIPRQLRLRNLSGIIITDFINMDDDQRMQSIASHLDTCLKKDPVTSKVVDITGLQLIEMTRKKVRKPLSDYFRYKPDMED